MASKWARNVGTDSHPVSYLHEYAVALLWDELDKGLLTGSEVRVRTSSGELSSNLLDGAVRMSVPDTLTPIGGYVPDLALFDESDRPVRVIEVVVTTAPSSDKIETLRKRGVDVVVTSVANENELKKLCWVPAEVRFARNERVEVRRNWSVSAQARYEERQRPSNRQIEDLCEALQSCSPEVRRQLLEVIHELDTMDSLYPLSRSNPKRQALEEKGG